MYDRGIANPNHIALLRKERLRRFLVDHLHWELAPAGMTASHYRPLSPNNVATHAIRKYSRNAEFQEPLGGSPARCQYPPWSWRSSTSSNAASRSEVWISGIGDQPSAADCVDPAACASIKRTSRENASSTPVPSRALVVQSGHERRPASRRVSSTGNHSSPRSDLLISRTRGQGQSPGRLSFEDRRLSAAWGAGSHQPRESTLKRPSGSGTGAASVHLPRPGPRRPGRHPARPPARSSCQSLPSRWSDSVLGVDPTHEAPHEARLAHCLGAQHADLPLDWQLTTPRP